MANRTYGNHFRRPGRRPTAILFAVALFLLVAGCGEESQVGGTEGPQPAADSRADQADELYPDVIEATALLDSDGTWTFSATLSSPYDTPARYADAWRVTGPDGEVHGLRELTHDHQAEQPFTRSQSGIQIPDDVSTVTVEGRDQVNGWGGATVEVILQR